MRRSRGNLPSLRRCSHRCPAALSILVLSACAVGPNFKSAPSVATGGYVAGQLPAATASTGVAGGEAQHFRVGADLSGQWWTLFGSDQLNGLILEAMKNYPDIAAQQAALRSAAENVRAEQGVFFPQVSANAQFSREKVSGAAIAPGFPSFITSVYQANVDVSYTLDLFGGERRALEGLQAQAAVQDFQLKASYLTLTSNVAATVIQLASLHDQVTATRQIIELEEKQLRTVQRQFDLGSQTRSDVLQQQSNLASVKATLPPLQQQLAATEHELALLTGHSPHDMSAVSFQLADLQLPQTLPVSLPSALVRQRPDVMAQEMTLRAACAAIGVATANMLPQLTLSGGSGCEALRSADLLKAGSSVWNAAAGLAQPLFEGGMLRAKRRAAVDAYEQSAAQYRLVVLKAFQNVADTLTALDNDAQSLKAQYDFLNEAQESLALIQRQFDAGAANSVTLLTAQQAYQQARVAYVRALASRFTDTVTLYQALGGGWWNRNDPGAWPVTAADALTRRTLED